MKPGLMKDAAIRVHELFRERKEPELFIKLANNLKNQQQVDP
jgi:hypothetical protein